MHEDQSTVMIAQPVMLNLNFKAKNTSKFIQKNILVNKYAIFDVYKLYLKDH